MNWRKNCNADVASGVPGHAFGIARDVGQVPKEGHASLQGPTTCHFASKGKGVETRQMHPNNGWHGERQIDEIN